MREIGSEFWSVPTISSNNNLFPESTQWFLSGRSALQAIIADIEGAKSVALPSWCCDSIIKPFLDAGLEIKYYPVFWSEELEQDIRVDCDVILIMDYFGYGSSSFDLTDYKGTVIRDLTHSLFSADHSEYDYQFGSLRKWCGIWTGGYAWTKTDHPISTDCYSDSVFPSLREKAMERKKDFLLNKRGSKEEYLDLFRSAEEHLDTVGIAKASDRDIRLAEKIDVEFIKYKRRENAGILHDNLSEMLMFKDFGPSDCPLFVPIMVPNGLRDKLHRFLISNDIFCPLHWPISAYHKLDSKTREIYENEISLVCDQRYSAEDMYRIVDTIKAFFREEKCH